MAFEDTLRVAVARSILWLMLFLMFLDNRITWRIMGASLSRIESSPATQFD
jgi:hypothetical protein